MAYLNIGDLAPDFSGVNQNNETVHLSDFKGKKVILYFYPRDNTPGCTAESCNLNENYSELRNMGYEVIGVSPDSVSSHQKFIAKFELGFNLIADTEKAILRQYGAWGEKSMYGKISEGVLRTTYIISEDGVIEKVFKKVDTKNHTAQILK